MSKNELVKILKVLADQTRLNILSNIYIHPNISGKELLSMQDISQPTLSFHLSKLEQINIIKMKKVGQTHYYVVNEAMVSAFHTQMNEWVAKKAGSRQKDLLFYLLVYNTHTTKRGCTGFDI